MSCCGGKGGSVWEFNEAQWKCRDCGKPTKGPEEIYQRESARFDEWKPSKKCECGADKVYGPGNGMHSATMPCPLYVKP
jgi:hypothetical protein